MRPMKRDTSLYRLDLEDPNGLVDYGEGSYVLSKLASWISPAGGWNCGADAPVRNAASAVLGEKSAGTAGTYRHYRHYDAPASARATGTIALLRASKGGRPTIAQGWGPNPEVYCSSGVPKAHPGHAAPYSRPPGAGGAGTSRGRAADACCAGSRSRLPSCVGSRQQGHW